MEWFPPIPQYRTIDSKDLELIERVIYTVARLNDLKNALMPSNRASMDASQRLRTS